MAFWIIISVLALVVAALLVMALVRGHVGIGLEGDVIQISFEGVERDFHREMFVCDNLAAGIESDFKTSFDGGASRGPG